MGGSYIFPTTNISERGTEKTYQELINHPHFKEPRLPNFLKTRPEDKLNTVIDYVTEVIARFVSPSPKVLGENEEFSCDDLAKAIREKIRPLIKEQFKHGNKLNES